MFIMFLNHVSSVDTASMELRLKGIVVFFSIIIMRRKRRGGAEAADSITQGGGVAWLWGKEKGSLILCIIITLQRL